MSENPLANALMSLAEHEGIDPEQLLKQMMQHRIGSAALPAYQAAAPPPAAPPQPQVIDRTPPPRRQDTESDAMAREKWLAAESLPTGVLGDAGMSSGGVFGQGVVATEGWDPAAHHRKVALERAAPALGAHVTQQLAGRLAAQQPPQLPPPQQHVRYYQSITVYEGPANQLPPPPAPPQFAQPQQQPPQQQFAYPQPQPHRQLPPAHYPPRYLPPRRR